MIDSLLSLAWCAALVVAVSFVVSAILWGFLDFGMRKDVPFVVKVLGLIVMVLGFPWTVLLYALLRCAENMRARFRPSRHA